MSVKASCKMLVKLPQEHENKKLIFVHKKLAGMKMIFKVKMIKRMNAGLPSSAESLS